MLDRVKNVLAGDLIEYVYVFTNTTGKIVTRFYLAVENARVEKLEYDSQGRSCFVLRILNLDEGKFHEFKLHDDWSGAIYRNGEPVYYSSHAAERDRILRKNANK